MLKPGEPAVKVKEYSQGDYFGELALLRNTPRAASIIARGACRVLYLDRDSFNRLLGNLEDVLRRSVNALMSHFNANSLMSHFKANSLMSHFNAIRFFK